MIRNLKTLGMAVVAVLAMSAMVASAASAANEFHSAGAPTTITGSQVGTNAFHVPGAGTVECTTATFHSSQSTTTTNELTVHPTYSGCKAFGFATTDVVTTGCDYTFTTPTATPTDYHTPTHVVCYTTPGPPHVQHTIKITPTVFGGSVCTVTVGSQSPSGTVDLKNEAGGKVLATSTVTGISHSAGCGAEAKADGTYTGSVLLQGSAGAISVS
jgi:hypothetical protein